MLNSLKIFLGRYFIHSVLVAFVGFYGVVAPAAAADPELFVRVKNNFRLFKTHDAQAQHLRDYCRYMRCAANSVTEFNNAPPLCDGVVAAFAKSNRGQACPSDRMRSVGGEKFWIPNNEPPNKRIPTIWSSKDYRYDVDERFLGEKRRTLQVVLNNAGSGWRCAFTLSQQDTTIASFPDVPCDRIPESQIEISDIPYGIEVEPSFNGRSMRKLKQEILAKNYIVISIGDSISAGEGLPHRLYVDSETAPDQWVERRCHRSLFNFTTLAMATAAEQALGSSFTYFNFACSGATVSKLIGDGSGGLVDTYPGLFSGKALQKIVEKFPADLLDGYTGAKELPAQIADAKEILTVVGDDGKTRIEPPDYVVITIGGNDVLFGPLVFQSILREDCKKSWAEWFYSRFVTTQPEECLFKLAEERIKTLDSELERVAVKLGELAPKRVLLVGYMNPTHDEGDATCKDQDLHVGTRLLGPSVRAKQGYLVDSKEAERAYSKVVTPLNEKLKAFAENVRHRDIWRYLEPNVIRKAGMRGWCAKPSWFVNYDDSMARQNDQAGTAHPNIYGQNWLNWLVRCHMASDGLLSKELVCRSSECQCYKPPTVTDGGLKG